MIPPQRFHVGAAVKLPVVRSSEKPLRFGGILDELNVNRELAAKKLEAPLAFKNAFKRSQVLGAICLQVGDIGLTGMELLKVLEELTLKHQREVITEKELREAIFPAGHGEEVVLSAYKVLSHLGCCVVESELSVSTRNQDYYKHSFALNSIGKQLLAEEVAKTSPIKAFQENEPVKPPTTYILNTRDTLIKTLLSTQLNQKTGWDVLKQIHGGIQAQWLLVRLYRGFGIKESSLLKNVLKMDRETAYPVLQSLVKAGLLDVEEASKPGNNLWYLTVKAKELLKKDDLVKALNLTDTDLQALFQRDIKMLHHEDTQREEHLVLLETKMEANINAFSLVKTDLEKAEVGLIELHRLNRETQNPLERSKLDRQVSKEMYQVELLQRKMETAKQGNDQLQKQIDASQASLKVWRHHSYERLKRLQEALLNLENGKFMKEMALAMQRVEKNHRGGTTGQDALESLFAATLQSAYGPSDPAALETSASTASVEDKGADISIKIAALQSKHSTVPLSIAVAGLKKIN